MNNIEYIAVYRDIYHDLVNQNGVATTNALPFVQRAILNGKINFSTQRPIAVYEIIDLNNTKLLLRDALKMANTFEYNAK